MDMRMVNGKGKRGRGSDGLRCGSTSGAGRLTRCRRHLECALWQRWHLCAAPWPMRTPRLATSGRGRVERSFETRRKGGSGLELGSSVTPRVSPAPAAPVLRYGATRGGCARRGPGVVPGGVDRPVAGDQQLIIHATRVSDLWHMDGGTRCSPCAATATTLSRVI